MANLTFLGAAGTVTGSKHLLEFRNTRLLLDCGLFQGLKHLRLQNWDPLPFPENRIDEVVLSHAHLDHSGWLPALVKRGWRGKVRCTTATADLLEILLPDSGHLQEQDAEFANRHGFSKHHPALPLYTEEDARRVLDRIDDEPFDRPFPVHGGAQVTFRRAGHILGAAIVELQLPHGPRVVFSGDLGRYDDPVMVDPTPIAGADYLILESTYGDRLHDRADPEAALADVVRRTAARGGTVVIPAFAVGRAQALLYHFHRLKQAGAIPNLPIYLDSPMAQDASRLYCRHGHDHRLGEQECKTACAVARFTRTVEDSKAAMFNPMPKVIISASGMATGGRVLHHLKAFLPDHRNTVVVAGFQAPGTRGEALAAGAEFLKIHGGFVPVRAEVANLAMLSAHADADEILRWLKGFEHAPRETFIVHGEPHAAAALKERIARELGWRVRVPAQLDTVGLA